MASKFRQISRSIHLWSTFGIFIPVVIVIGSGLLLQIKKEVDWIQPPTQKGVAITPSLSFEAVLQRVQQVEAAGIGSWQDIDRLDVRPDKGVIKVRGKNRWEVQLDSQTGEVLHVAFRRTDTIEALHDGSWFFEGAKLWLFLPAGILLFGVWMTGMVMLITTLRSKYVKHRVRKHR